MNKEITKSLFAVIETPNSIEYIPISSNDKETHISISEGNEMLYIISGYGINLSGKWEVFDTQDELKEFLQEIKEWAN